MTFESDESWGRTPCNTSGGVISLWMYVKPRGLLHVTRAQNRHNASQSEKGSPFTLAFSADETQNVHTVGTSGACCLDFVCCRWKLHVRRGHPSEGPSVSRMHGRQGDKLEVVSSIWGEGQHLDDEHTWVSMATEPETTQEKGVYSLLYNKVPDPATAQVWTQRLRRKRRAKKEKRGNL